MKRCLLTGIAILTFFMAFSQKQMLINEDFEQKMIDLKEAWTDFDMPTKVNGREARFTAFQCKYYSTASPSRPCECSKGYIGIEASKNDYVPYFEFPEFPSCSLLRLGVQAGGKDGNTGIVLQKLENSVWVAVDEITLEPLPKGKCMFWEPKNATSQNPVKFRIIANKSGNIILTDVYAEQF